MSSTLQLARIAGAVLMMSLSAATARAEDPRPDALKMRNAPRASSALATPSLPTAAQPALIQFAPTLPAQADRADSATSDDKAMKQASEALELCYSLARRSDRSLAAQVTVQASVRRDGSVELRAQKASLGKGYFARCVERKVGALLAVRQLPEATADTQTIVLGGEASEVAPSIYGPEALEDDRARAVR